MSNLIELEPVWEIPVTATMIHKAMPEIGKHVAARTLEKLSEACVLYVCDGWWDELYYLPTRLSQVRAVQKYGTAILSNGTRRGNDER